MTLVRRDGSKIWVSGREGHVERKKRGATGAESIWRWGLRKGVPLPNAGGVWSAPQNFLFIFTARQHSLLFAMQSAVLVLATIDSV